MSEIKDQPAQTAAETAADAVKTLLFYVHPVALNRDAHRNLRLVPKPGDYGFAKSTNSVPLAAVEFADACGDYPIVFAGPDKERLIPAVLVGLKADENLFVGSDK
ncbi:MAG: SapC family protein, partial [Sinobacteraceae bacterium]|nr:SapC family protein [Nevskiaceae bacterium]